MNLDTTGDEELYVHMTGDQYLLVSRDCQDLTRHNDLKVREHLSTRFSCAGFQDGSYIFASLPYITNQCALLHGC